MMRFSIQLTREQDDRWIAEVPELPGVLVYDSTSEAAIAKAKALRCASWLTAWTTVKQLPTWPA